MACQIDSLRLASELGHIPTHFRYNRLWRSLPVSLLGKANVTHVGNCMDAPTSELEYASLGSIVASIALLVASLVWIATGSRAVVLLAQHGHDLGRWSRVGMALGPLLAGWALLTVRQRDAGSVEFIEVAAGERGPGDISILVAVLGEPEKVAAADPVLRRLADRVDEIVLLRPINAGGTGNDSGTGTIVSAAKRLSHAALFVSGPQPRLILASGEGATAVNRFARNYRPGVVIVVGEQGPTPGSET
jgi:hypothetical protein